MGNARIGVDSSGLKSGLKEARNELKMLKAEFKELTSAAELLNKKEDQLNKKMEAASKVINGYNKLAQEYNKNIEKGEKRVKELAEQKDKLTKELEEAKQATEKDEKAIQKLTKQLDDCKRKIEAEEKALNSNNVQLHNTNTEINKLKKTYNAYEEELKKVIETTEDLGETSQETAESIEEVGEGDGVKKLGQNVVSAQDAMSKLEDITAEVRDRVDEITNSYEDLVKNGIEKAINKMGELAQKTEEYGSRSESALAKVGTLADDTDAISADIRSQTKQFGFDYDAIAEGIYDALSSGVSESNVGDFSEIANKLAIAGFTDSATTIDALTTIINSFKYSQGDASKLASILLNTQDLGKVTVGEMGSDISTVASTAAMSGVSFEDIMTAVSYTTAGGINSSQSMTAINSMIEELSDITSNAGKIIIQKTGKTFSELMAEGYNLRDMLEVLGNSGETAALVLGEDFIKTKSKLDESYFKDAKSIEEVMAIALANGADLSASLTDIFSSINAAKAGGALYTQSTAYDYGKRKFDNEQLDGSLLDRNFNKLINTTENQKNIFKQTWQDVLIEMWQGDSASKGMQGYFGEALAEINDVSNEFIEAFDFDVIDDLGSTILDVVVEICNIFRDNKELILEVIYKFLEFIKTLIEYLPTIINDLLPAAAEFSGKVIDKLIGLTNYIPAISELFGLVLTYLPEIMSVLYFIQGLFSALNIVAIVGGIIIAFQTLAPILSTVVPAAASAAAGALSFLAGPIGIVIAAIGVLITCFVVLYNKSEIFRAKVNEVAGLLKGAFLEAIESIRAALKRMADALGLTTDKTKESDDAIGNFAATIVEVLGGAFVVIINVIEGFVESIAITIEQVKALANVVSSFFQALNSGDFSQVKASLDKVAALSIQKWTMSSKIMHEVIDEWDGKKKSNTTTKTTSTNKTIQDLSLVSGVDYNYNDILANANLNNYNNILANANAVNNNVSKSTTPVVNNNNKAITANNYYYSPKAIDERTASKYTRDTLKEACFSVV